MSAGRDSLAGALRVSAAWIFIYFWSAKIMAKHSDSDSKSSKAKSGHLHFFSIKTLDTITFPEKAQVKHL